MSFCNFYVGQKVVCIDAADTNIEQIAELVEGQVYTIGWVGPYQPPASWRCGKGICVRVLECRNQFPQEPPFWARRFKPVTDISMLEKMLTTAPIKEEV